MTIAHSILNVLLFPWRVLKGIGHTLSRVLFSARVLVLLLLLIIAVLVVYYALSDRHTPFTTDAYVQAYVVQVAPRVEGQVVRVHVKENQVVQKNDLLFEIDPRPFEHKVAQLEAKVELMKQQVAQMDSDLAAARADDAKLLAEESYARAVHEQELYIFKKEATTDRKYLDAVQKYKASQAATERSRALIRKAEQALAARIDGEHALIAEARAELADAKLNLEWTRIYAPVNGLVTNLQLREGAYSHIGKPVLTCIDSDQWWVVANYRENCLENIRAGQPVGLTFNTYPGRVFNGTVQSVGWGVNEGQGIPSGELPAVRNPQQWVRSAQRFQVRVLPSMPADTPLRVGATVTTTVYTNEDYQLKPVAEFWQRLMSWLDYVY